MSPMSLSGIKGLVPLAITIAVCLGMWVLGADFLEIVGFAAVGIVWIVIYALFPKSSGDENS